jgi:hypothetical protein
MYIQDNSSAAVTNSILWADAPEEISVETGTITVTYSDIQGGWEGTGNINDDPLFVGAGDYHLTAGSPSIDAGTSDDAPGTDIEGTTRPQGNGYDMGAYEEFIIPGDIDYSENIDLRDAILALQVCIGIAPTSAIHKEADVNGDNKIGIAEAIYALQISADLYRHPTVSLDDQNSSYMLQKTSLHIDRQGIRQTNPGTFVHAIAYADFDNDGDEDVFMSSGGGINPTPVEMYLNDGEGNFTLDLTIFQGEVPNLVHPRKALVSDFNGDGLPDVFVIGHGYDQPPWPGEHPVLILSSPTGLQNVGGLENYVGFQHGGASADIDADGDVDIFVVDTNQPFFLMNVGSGSFTYDTQRLPGELTGRPLFTAELIDVDMDGYFDLLVAGHEHEGMQTTIYWGSNTWTYTASNKTILPIVTGQGTVLDIDAEDLDNDGDRDIVITRTGGGQGNFYVGYYIQIIVNAGGRQFADETGQRIANGTGANWIDWIRLQDWNNDNHLDIVVDDYSRNLIWFNNGAGSF